MFFINKNLENPEALAQLSELGVKRINRLWEEVETC